MCQQIKAAGIIPWTFNESDKWLGADFFLPLIAQATDDTNWSTISTNTTKKACRGTASGHHRARMVDKLAKAGIFQMAWSAPTGHVNRALLRRRRGHDDGWVVGAAGHPPERFAGIRVLVRVFKMPAWAPG